MRLALGVCAVLLTGHAQAHDFWIEPSSFRPQAGSIVKVRLFVGEAFVGDPLPRQSNTIDRFFVRQDGTDTKIAGANNIDPAGLFRRDGESTALIGYSSTGATLDRRDEAGKPVREKFYRYAKALLTGTNGSGVATQALGFAYEIVPGDDPARIAGPLRARVLHDGKPLAGALVEALWRDDPSIRLATHSDAQGSFVLALPRPGVWLVKSMHMVRAGFFASHDWYSLWASLTLEAP